LGVFIKNDNQIELAIETGYEDGKENKLENLIIQNPEIFPVEYISVNSKKWIPIAKQIRLITGRTDTIGVDDEGGIYIIENKLDVNPDKKTVRQQARDYAHAFRKLRDRKDGWDEFLRLIKHANESETDDVQQLSFSKKDLKEILHSTKDMDAEKAEECFEDIKKNFNDGLYTLVVAIDKISKPLRISIDGENEIDGNALPMFALEVKECKTNSNETIIVTNTYPYDLDEIRRKVTATRVQNNSEIFNKQFAKSTLSQEQKELFGKFRSALAEISGNVEFNHGKLAMLLPRFDSLGGNRSPIGLCADGVLKIQFDILWEHGDLKNDFESRLSTLPEIAATINTKKQYLSIEPKVWLSYKDEILSILDDVFVKE